MTAPYIALIVIYFLTCVVSFLLSRIWLTEKLAFLSTVIFLLALYFFDSVNGGNIASWTVEEISVLPILYFIYLVCKELKFTEIEDRSVKAKYWILNGVGFSFIAWSKYQILGSYLGVFIAILILCVLKKFTWQRFREVVLLNIVPFIVISGSIMVYFISVNGLNALVNCYFFNKTDRINSNVFPSEIFNAFEFIYKTFIVSSPLYFILIFVFILSLSVNKFANNMYKGLKLIIILGFAFTIICESVFIRWGQNRIIMFCFVIFGVIWLLKYLSIYTKMMIKTLFIVIICLVIFCQFSISFLHNTTHYRTPFYKFNPMIQINNSFVAQYKDGKPAGEIILDYINQKQDNKNYIIIGDSALGIGSFYYYAERFPQFYYWFLSDYKNNRENYMREIYDKKSVDYSIIVFPNQQNNQFLNADFFQKSGYLKRIYINYKPILAIEQFNKIYILYENR
jgi:hypothetical protein